MIEANGIITVTVDNHFTNKFGKLSQETIALYYKADSLGRMILYDSKGLSNFVDNDDFNFGSKTGYIDNRTDTTDQQIIRKFKKDKAGDAILAFATVFNSSIPSGGHTRILIPRVS